MEDITPYNRLTPAHAMQPEALQSISAALRKVKLKLTRQQLGSIAIIMQMHVNKARPRGVFELAQLYECYKLAEKLRLKMMRNPERVKLSLTLPEAAALYDVMDNTEFADFAQYESNLALYIIMTIDEQTV